MKRRHPHKTNVLLVNITRLGDMLQATPTIAGMKMENPDCKVTVIVEKQFEEICHFLPAVDEVVPIDLTYTVRHLSREADGIIDAYEYVDQIVEDLKSRNFDYCLNMSSSGYTALLLKLLDIRRNGGWIADDEGHRVIESDWARLFASSVFHQNRQYNALNLVDIFRCSADVEAHPKSLQMEISDDAVTAGQNLLREAHFTAKGPVIVLQAGASQQKRQWKPERFIKLTKLLRDKLDARIILVGTKKELKIIDPIKGAFLDDRNVFNAAGRTSIPELAAILKQSNLLITGDTGTMHIAAAVETPIISMFLASAFGYETGPYGDGHIILQPVIGCGPCNPNKSCSGLECHDTIDPELITWLAERKLQSPTFEVPDDIAPPTKVRVYQTGFDRFGFYELKQLNSSLYDPIEPYRRAYRKVWLDELGGFEVDKSSGSALQIKGGGLEGMEGLISRAEQGVRLIEELIRYIKDQSVPAANLRRVNGQLNELDREIEQLGFHYPHLGPVTRMFIFAKENLSGTDPVELSSQMKENYTSLNRRCQKLAGYF